MAITKKELSRLQKNARNKLYRLRKKGVTNAQINQMAVPVKSWDEVQTMSAREQNSGTIYKTPRGHVCLGHIRGGALCTPAFSQSNGTKSGFCAWRSILCGKNRPKLGIYNNKWHHRLD